MEQVGERQDFESELSRLGLKHEDFHLQVRKAAFNAKKTAWTSNYAVAVTNSVTGRRNIYWGGPRQDWVAQFVVDLRNGLFGDPSGSLERSPARQTTQAPRRTAS
jgi:hypothetical protein